MTYGATYGAAYSCVAKYRDTVPAGGQRNLPPKSRHGGGDPRTRW